MNISNSYPSTHIEADRQGWTSAPNLRGTIDILWSSCLTLFLCCWSVLVVNVPQEGKSSQLIIRKIFLVCLCALAPELVFQVSLGQWLAARGSLSMYKQSKVPKLKEWTIRHIFYAHMGGFHLKTPDFVSFPLNADQLLYLVERGYLKVPEISASHIRDKNKLDGMLRFVTLVQTLWFVANVIGRAAQGLAITALELSTVAFVLLGAATSTCWMSKPADVEMPDTLTTDISMAQILIEAGDAARGTYYYTPLDFVSRREWAWSRLWSHGLHLLQVMHIAAPPLQRPIPRIQNTIIAPIEGKYYLLFVMVSITYFSIFIAGWNFSFPTPIERTLWQVASVVALVTALSVCLALQLTYSWLPACTSRLGLSQEKHTEATDNGTTLISSEKGNARPNRYFWWVSNLENNSTLQDPELRTPIGLIAATWLLGIPYCLARAYVVIADFVELRSLPANAYQTVDWTSFWPHF